MSHSASFQVKVLSSPAFIDFLRREWATSPSQQVQVISSGPERDPTFLAFDLSEVAALVGILEGSLFIGMFVHQVFAGLQSGKTKRVVIQTPMRRVEVVATKDLTEAHVREILQGSLKIAA